MSTVSPTPRNLSGNPAILAERLKNREIMGKIAGALLAVLIVIYPPRLVSNLTLNGADFFILIFAIFNLSLIISLARARIIMAFVLFYAVVLALSFHYSAFYFFSSQNLILQILKNAVSIAFFGISILFFMRLPAAAVSFVTGTLAVTAVLAFVGAINVFVTGWEFRATATFANPNAFGGYLLFGFSYVLIRSLTDRFTVVRGGFLLIVLVAFLATGSRGALVALASGVIGASLFIVYFYSDQPQVRRNARLLLFIFVPVTFGYLFYKLSMAGGDGTDSIAMDTYALSRLSETLGGGGRNVDQRLILWLMAWNLFESSPWVGVGIGQFEMYSASVLGESRVTHNTYLAYLAEGGILGGLFCLAFMVYAANQCWRVGRYHPQFVFCACFLIAIFVQGLVTNVDNFRILWIGLGLTVACIHSPAIRTALASRRGL